ncbi:hypothetical protein GCM10028809_32950 [Spirosoma gilvum]
MVFVFMGEQDRIELLKIEPKYLLAEVGAGVDDETASVHSNMDGGTESFIPEVDRTAYIALAANQRHT